MLKPSISKVGELSERKKVSWCSKSEKKEEGKDDDREQQHEGREVRKDD